MTSASAAAAPVRQKIHPGPRTVAVSAGAVAVMIPGQFAMLAIVPVLLVLIGTFRNPRLHTLRWWSTLLAALYGTSLALWAIGPDRAQSLSKDLNPVLAGLITAAALAVLVRHFVIRRSATPGRPAVASNQPTTQHVPTEIDHAATVVVTREVQIQAPLEIVWRQHTDINAWPTWQTDVETAQVDGELTPGTTFRWSAHGLDIASTVYAIDAPHRILWGGPAQGITGIHEWTFTADGEATVVRTAESWEGDPVRADTENLKSALDASLGTWLELLRTTAEATTEGTRSVDEHGVQNPEPLR